MAAANKHTPNMEEPFPLNPGLYLVIFPKDVKYRDTTTQGEGFRICFGEINYPELYDYYNALGYIIGKMKLEGTFKMSVLKWGPPLANLPTENNIGKDQKYSYEAFFIKLPSKHNNQQDNKWKVAIKSMEEACHITNEQKHLHTKFF